MNSIRVKNLIIGSGRPKICVPLVADTPAALQAAVAELLGVEYDLVEFRADFLNAAADQAQVLACLKSVRAQLPDVPLLFTFRTFAEGGACEMAPADYFDLLHAAAASGDADLIDIELFAGDEGVQAAIAAAKAHGVAVVLCNHDFQQTPAEAEIVGRLCRMQDWGADICKIAVMPQSAADVLTLLSATETMQRCHARRPLITMAMGRLGIVSRLSGEVFGSAVSFGAAGQASAPGQIDAGDLRFILQVLAQD